jgi:hypothetical protein
LTQVTLRHGVGLRLMTMGLGSTRSNLDICFLLLIIILLDIATQITCVYCQQLERFITVF